MAVLAEAISVIIRKQAIEQRLPGGMDAFMRTMPNRTFCEDTHLCRLGFLSPAETAVFTERLQMLGLCFLGEDGEAQDFAVVDQQHGPTTACAWLTFGRVRCDEQGNEVSACWLDESHAIRTDEPHLTADPLVTPPGWRFETSLSRNFLFTPNPVSEFPLDE